VAINYNEVEHAIHWASKIYILWPWPGMQWCLGRLIPVHLTRFTIMHQLLNVSLHSRPLYFWLDKSFH